MRRWIVFLLMTAALVVLVAACIGDGNSDRQQEARSYMQSLCTEELVDWFVLGAELGSSENQPETLDEIVNLFSSIEEEADRFYLHLASVDPPGEMRDWHTNALAGLEDARRLGTDFEEAVASGNESELAAIGKRAERLDVAFDSLSQMDVPAEYVDAWEEDCFPKIKDRLPEAELD